MYFPPHMGSSKSLARTVSIDVLKALFCHDSSDFCAFLGVRAIFKGMPYCVLPSLVMLPW